MPRIISRGSEAAATTRQAAAVSGHLYREYAKLEITSRTAERRPSRRSPTTLTPAPHD